MEVKMFVGADAPTVEENINEWLQENKVAVQHLGQSQCERNGKFVFVISLFYESPALQCG
jgi:hypothetical protein